MYNNDYIVAIDENGQPYIAHAFGDRARAAWGSLKGTATKYKEKIPLGNGKYRYVYEQAKKAAKKAWGSKAGRWIDEHDAGISEEIMRQRAKRKSRAAFKKGDATTARQYAHRAAELRDEAKSERERAKRTLAAAPKRAWGSKVGRFIDDHDAGISERLMANYYSRKSKNASKKGYNDDATTYSARSSALRKESRDESAAARERLRSLTTRKKKSEVSETSATSSSQNTNDDALKKTIAKMSTQIKANPAIPKNSNVSDEYLLDMGFNSRVSSVNKFDAARDALTVAQRDYNRVSKLSSSSGEVRAEKSDALKALKKAQKEYDDLRQQVIDEINEKDYIERMARFQR